MSRPPARPSTAELRRGEAAAWGPRPDAAQRPRLRLVAFTPLVKGALRGFATVELPIGLKLYDVAVFVGDKRPWAMLPTKPRLDRDRRQKVGADGKPVFTAAAEWRALVRAEYPDALGDDG